jgi:mono/diheme cytochrome c family protein
MIENMRTYSWLVLLGGVVAIVLGIYGPRASGAPPTYNARSAAQLYSNYCIECHGRDGRSQTTKGKHNHARDLSNGEWQQDVSDERIFNSIMNGRNVRGNMPAFSKKLNDGEADSLVGFVRALRE